MAWLHVVAAVVDDGAGRVLIARRPDHLHQGGLWEFPGGKVEPGEAPRAALARELHEEVGIEIEQAHPLIQVRHAYPDRRVVLDVWRIGRFRGTAHGREGQPVRWVAADELPDYEFPAANLPIVTAARLPACYLITPEPDAVGRDAFFAQLEACVAGGIRLVQLRAPALSPDDYRRHAERALAICRRHGARLLLNAAPELVTAIGADGVHLSATRLRALNQRPLGRALWVGASCHDGDELAHAAALGVDFAVLSPVNATASHPCAAPLGWTRAAALANESVIPIFALGGVGKEDLDTAWQHGMQGVAAIRGLWAPASGRRAR